MDVVGRPNWAQTSGHILNGWALSRLEEIMAYAAFALPDPGGIPSTVFPAAGFADQQCAEPHMNSRYGFEDIIGTSPALQRVLKEVAIVAPTGATVLLHGET